MGSARASYPTTAVIKRAVDTAKSLGLDVAGYEITADGSVRVFEARALPKAGNLFDKFANQI